MFNFSKYLGELAVTTDNDKVFQSLDMLASCTAILPVHRRHGRGSLIGCELGPRLINGGSAALAKCLNICMYQDLCTYHPIKYYRAIELHLNRVYIVHILISMFIPKKDMIIPILMPDVSSQPW